LDQFCMLLSALDQISRMPPPFGPICGCTLVNDADDLEGTLGTLVSGKFLRSLGFVFEIL
jgi:hypothetical protein